jgi:hypothetical protein
MLYLLNLIKFLWRKNDIDYFIQNMQKMKIEVDISIGLKTDKLIIIRWKIFLISLMAGFPVWNKCY